MRADELLAHSICSKIVHSSMRMHRGQLVDTGRQRQDPDSVWAGGIVQWACWPARMVLRRVTGTGTGFEMTLSEADEEVDTTVCTYCASTEVRG